MSRPRFGGLTYSNVQNLTLNAQTGNPTININSTVAAVTIHGGGTDTVNIGTGFFSSDVQSIQGLVVIDNTAARATTINIDDSGDSKAQNFILGTNADGLCGYVHDMALSDFNVVYRYADTSSLRLNTGTASGNAVGVYENGVPPGRLWPGNYGQRRRRLVGVRASGQSEYRNQIT